MRKSSAWQKFVKKNYRAHSGNRRQHKTVMSLLSRLYRKRNASRRPIRQKQPSTMTMENGVQIWRNAAGQIHREDGPAMIATFRSNRINAEIWYRNDEIFREDDKPADVVYFDDEDHRVRSETWYKDGEYGRDDDKPVQVVYFNNEDHQIQFEYWLDSDTAIHRDGDKPAIIEYFDGPFHRVKKQQWNANRSRIRPGDKPAYIEYEDTPEHKIVSENWWDTDGNVRKTIERKLIGHGVYDAEIIETITLFKNNKKSSEIIRTFVRGGTTGETAGEEPFLTGLQEKYYLNGKLHREDGPAVLHYAITYDDNAVLMHETWYKDDKIHRDGDDPAETEYFDIDEHRIQGQSWYKNGDYYRENGKPAMIQYFDNAAHRIEVEGYFLPDSKEKQLSYFDNDDHLVSTETWYVDGERDRRNDEPAITEYYDGPEHRLKVQAWYESGLLNRNGDQPSRVTYFNSPEQRINKKEWYLEGMRHREDDKPAVIEFEDTPDHHVIARQWFFEDEEMRSPPDYEWEDYDEESDQQTSCPLDNNVVREDKPVQGLAKCKTIFDVSDTQRQEMTILGPMIYNLIQECNLSEIPEVDSSYLLSTVHVLQRKLPLRKDIKIKTVSGREVSAAIPFHEELGSFIPQATSTLSKFKVQYSDQPGIDYGGMTRQFIGNLMDQLSRSLFSEIELEYEPFVDIRDDMTEAEKRKARNEVVPRYYITRKPDEELRKIFQMPAQQPISKLFELAGAMVAYAAINQIPFSVPLSRLLLKKMLQPGTAVSIEEAIAYHILDSGKMLSKSLSFLMDIPEEDRKDYLEDFQEALSEKALETYNGRIVNQRTRSSFATEEQINERLANFCQGFSNVTTILQERNVTINELHHMIYRSAISREDMENFLGKVKYHNLDNRQIEKVKETILNLEDYNQLMRWWSGIPALLDKGYSVRGFNNPVQKFVAHTCFFEIEIDLSLIDSPDFLGDFKQEIKYTRTSTV